MTILKEYRIKERYKQRDMANMLNTNINTYRSYELGLRMMPYDFLANFLILRNNEDDKKLAKILKEIDREGN